VSGVAVSGQAATGTAAGSGDLVVVMVPGVQQFVAESRTTGDVRASSEIIASLVGRAIDALPDDVQVVFPSSGVTTELTNRIVLVAPPGRGVEVARGVGAAIADQWRALCNEVSQGRGGESLAERLVAESVGFPSVRWVVVGPEAGDYAEQWRVAATAVDGRKRIQDFPAYHRAAAGGQRFAVCSVSGRRAAVNVGAAARLPVRGGESLSAPALVKRIYARERAPRGGYPSTWSIASAAFRSGVGEAIRNGSGHSGQLRQAVRTLVDAVAALARAGAYTGDGRLPGLDPGGDAELAAFARLEGGWVYPDNWEPRSVARENGLDVTAVAEVCRQGRSAAQELLAVASSAGIPAPSPYLAVIVQDGDHMGRRLSKGAASTPLREWHAQVSAALVAAARAQRERLEQPDLLGWTVYTGGDDVLGFAPVRSALAATRELNSVFVAGVAELIPMVSASSSLVFFHASSPLQSVLSEARNLLQTTKQHHRPGLGVAVFRRGGERVRLVLPWTADPPADLGTPRIACLEALVAAVRTGLSPRLASELERGRDQLATLSEKWLEAELRRLVRRHRSVGADSAAAAVSALLSAGGRVRGRADDESAWQLPQAAVLAQFIASEGR
jgi:CRISPR-associated protein Cmr2